MEKSHYYHTWLATLSQIWDPVKPTYKKKSDDELYWYDPIAWAWHINQPPEIPKDNDDFTAKIMALCDAIRYYTPKQHETETLLIYSQELQQIVKKMQKEQALFYHSVKVENYQNMIDEQTNFLEKVQQCRNEVIKLKKILPNNWEKTLHQYFELIESSIH